MLDTKKLLAKILKRINFRSVTVTALSATSISAASTAWVTVPLPSSGTAVGLHGYYINGTGNTLINVYNMNLTSSGAQFALRNMGTSTASVTLSAFYQVVD